MVISRLIKLTVTVLVCVTVLSRSEAQDTRLLRQPTISAKHVAFTYGSDIWTVEIEGGKATRITSTAAVERSPHLSPDGEWIAFTSNRSGTDSVYVVASGGGEPRRLTWYPANSTARGWSPDGKKVLYSTSRESAPVAFDRLWMVPLEGGASERVPAPWGFDGSYSPSGKRMVVDRVTRWDTEWRHYRGGQNTPLTILDLESLEETRIANERTTDIQPIWLGEKIYFLSDRDWVMNIWSYDTSSKALEKLTDYTGADIKWLNGHEDQLVFEREGYLHLFDLPSQKISRLHVSVVGDFPWAEKRWEDVEGSIRSASLSSTGKRALFEARGEIFTVPVENGSTRNLTQSSDVADRAPLWSPQGDKVAWFTDEGDGYRLRIENQDGSGEARLLELGESKMAWEPVWSPDASRIAFVDDDVRIRVIELESGDIQTVDVGGVNIERGSMEVSWSPDSKWLAYAKTYPNNLRRIVAWSATDAKAYALTDSMADAISPAWDRDGKHLYFLASTDVALATGWANTSRMAVEPRYGAYVILLSDDADSPFAPESDEEKAEEKADDDGKEQSSEESSEDKSESKEKENSDSAKSSAANGDAPEQSDKKGKRQRRKNKRADKEPADSAAKNRGASRSEKRTEKKKADTASKDAKATDNDQPKPDAEEKEEEGVDLDRDFISRRILALPIGVSDLRFTIAGPAGSVFVGEAPAGGGGIVLHKFTLEDEKKTEFLKDVRQVSLSSDGKKMLFQSGGSWQVADTSGPAGKGKALKVALQMHLDRSAEWTQIFDEAWRYMRDYFYDPGMHGRDWDIVRERYSPLVPFIRHRSDLTYLLDQMSGEMSVGHSFVFGGDTPDIDRRSRVGLLGADLEQKDGLWKIKRIFTFESWNPGLRAPLDRPGLDVSEGDYILAINDTDLVAAEDPYRLLDGTVGQQTTLTLSKKPSREDSWQVVVEPQSSEGSLRQRAWVEDNRRRVDELSEGKLAYVWVPNTSQPGVISFNRYFFAQQDRQGAVIDERYNGGGLLDDYMVDLMTRNLRAALTNEVPNGRPFRLPAGLLGPKVLLINERAGSGGDFFPWVFRQQKAGPLIGTRTWGGLVKSSVHYSFVDGGAMTAPDNAVFDPNTKQWIGENKGIAPDIEVLLDAKSVAKGIDPQLERGVKELLEALKKDPPIEIQRPDYPTPTIQK